MTSECESNADLSQNIFNKVAEIAIASQLNSADKIDVNLQSDTSQLLQGKTDALQISGEKVVTLDDLHLEKIDITCQDISLNLTQVLLGNIVFERSGNFQVKFVFTESDCDRLLNSQYVRVLLQNLELDIDRQSACFYLQQSRCSLQQQNNLSLTATVVLQRQKQIEAVPFEIALQFAADGSEIGFRSGKYLEDRTLEFQKTVAIMNKVRDLLYLRHFENEDLACHITQIKIQAGQLVIKADLKIEHLPDSISQSLKSVSSEINS